MAVIGVKTGEPDKRGSAASRVAASRARRCLFGRMTDAELAHSESEWQQHDRRIDDEKRRKWNFDFRRMTPLPGRWQWERVSGAVSQQTPTGGPSVERRPDDAAPTAPTVSPTDEATPELVISGSSAAAVETTSSTDTPTCGEEPRRKRCRQSTLPGTVRS